LNKGLWKHSFVIGGWYKMTSVMFQLSWLQISPEQTVLTVDRDVISTDSRLSVGPFTKESQEFWSLHINPSKASDEGWYSCQLNTYPQTVHRIYLSVVCEYGTAHMRSYIPLERMLTSPLCQHAFDIRCFLERGLCSS
jgi:hypothetical protein